MSIRLGPFRFVYSEREQKLRDTLAHLIEKHGIYKARLIISVEAADSCLQTGIDSEQTRWWRDLRWNIKELGHRLAWGQSVGIR